MREIEREARNESLMCAGKNPKRMKPAPYRFDRDDEFHTPPPFVRCDCNDGQIFTGSVGLEVKCPKCKNSPLSGWIPQYYTPKQYRDWIRRENGLPDYELPQKTPVLKLVEIEYGINDPVIKKFWFRETYYESCGSDSPVVIDTIAGRPPEDWRPE